MNEELKRLTDAIIAATGGRATVVAVEGDASHGAAAQPAADKVNPDLAYLKANVDAALAMQPAIVQQVNKIAGTLGARILRVGVGATVRLSDPTGAWVLDAALVDGRPRISITFTLSELARGYTVPDLAQPFELPAYFNPLRLIQGLAALAKEIDDTPVAMRRSYTQASIEAAQLAARLQ